MMLVNSFQQAVACMQRGDLTQAKSLCNEILRTDAKRADVLHLLGFMALQQGQASEAIEYLRRSVAADSRQPVAHMSLANALLQRGELQKALEHYDRAVSLQPDYADAFSNRGSVLLRLGRPAPALASFERAIRLKPQFAQFHCSRAHALRELGRLADALEGFDQALRLNSRLLDAHFERANLLLQLERPLEALVSYGLAGQLAPADADIAFNQGGALYLLGRLDEALASYDTAIRNNPSFAKAHCYRGKVLLRMQRWGEALESYSRAANLQPSYSEALSGASDALRSLNRLEDALSAAEQAWNADNTSSAALRSRARCLLALNRPEESVADFDELLRREPDTSDYSLGLMLHARLSCFDWRDYDALAGRILAGVDAGLRVTLPSLFLPISSSSEQQLRCARVFADDNGSAAKATRAGYEHSKIRLAYVSADFREHPVTQLLVRTIELHDRERFEVIGISLRPAHDSELGQRIARAFDRFIDVSDKSDSEVAGLLQAIEVDIAIDLNGYTDGFRAPIFARRAAPLQVNFLGYTGTMGASFYDYILADEIVVPPEQAPFYSEAVSYLPGCYLPNDPTQAGTERMPTRAEHSLPDGAFVFCCFNAVHKILPDVFDIWMGLLRKVPAAVLWLARGRESVVRNLRQEARKREVDPDRLIFAERVGTLAAHRARLGLADLFLDTMPFNAHTTACDALMSGLPVLTCTGSTFAGRVATSLLTALELPELICADRTAYESQALRLATEAGVLDALRARLGRNRATADLFNSEHYTRKLEAAYERMHKKGPRVCHHGAL